jgi:elongator complex protein 2
VLEEDDKETMSQEVAAKSIRVPLERDLGVASVWPERDKLFGHTSELICVTSASTGDDSVIVASSTKARDAEAASIRIWQAATGKCVQILSSHRSTVATMSFSSSARYLVSSGKDRKICLWEKQKDQFSLAWSKESAHKRIVWAVHFNPTDETVFASGSRDGCCKIWKIQDTTSCNVALLHSFTPTCSALEGKPISVTALSFAPTTSRANVYLAIGTESGMIEMWTVPLCVDGSTAFCFAIPAAHCHSSSVTKLAWRPHHEGKLSMLLASCSSDNGCKVFELRFDEERRPEL